MVEHLSNRPPLSCLIAAHATAHSCSQGVTAEADQLPADALCAEALWLEGTDLAAVVCVHLQETRTAAVRRKGFL
jgi:hypothetical protein